MHMHVHMHACACGHVHVHASHQIEQVFCVRICICISELMSNLNKVSGAAGSGGAAAGVDAVAGASAASGADAVDTGAGDLPLTISVSGAGTFSANGIYSLCAAASAAWQATSRGSPRRR